MPPVLEGLVGWLSAGVDRDGHRSYTARFKINSTREDGQASILKTPGLPTVGSTWAFGTDIDQWAFCTPEATITPVVSENEPNFIWHMDIKYSTRPLSRCQEGQIENPLLEVPNISGSFINRRVQAKADYEGKPIHSSSFEPIRGEATEIDLGEPSIIIAMNSATLPLAMYSEMMNGVNDSTLWGLPPRTVRLANAEFSRKAYGTCTYYFTVTYHFAVKYDTHDVTVPDEGTKILMKGGDRTNPSHFALYKDRFDENSRVYLDGLGHIWNGVDHPNPDDPDCVDPAKGYLHPDCSSLPGPALKTFKLRNQFNFFLLGIPASLA